MVIVILSLIAFSVSMMSNALRRSLSDYRTLIEQAGEGVIVLDKNRRIAMCNSSASEVFGVPEAELLGRSFKDFCRRRICPLWIGRPASLHPPNHHRDDCAAPRRKGAPPFDDVHTAACSQEGRWVGIIAVLRDVTRTREADNQIRLLAQALQSTDSCVRISDTWTESSTRIRHSCRPTVSRSPNCWARASKSRAPREIRPGSIKRS